MQCIIVISVTPRKLTCPLKRDHFKGHASFNHQFSGDMLVFYMSDILKTYFTHKDPVNMDEGPEQT